MYHPDAVRALLWHGQWKTLADWPPIDRLIVSVQRGDVDALEALYERCGSSVYAVARRILSNSADADDVVQETFLQVWQQAKQFDRRRASVKGWILMIGRSRALDRGRRVAAHLRREEKLDRIHNTPAAEVDACERAMKGEQARSLQHELDGLSPGQRTIVDLSFMEGLSHTQIAGALSMPLGTVKTKIRDAVQRMRDGVNGTPPRRSVSEPSPFTNVLAHFLASRAKQLETDGRLRGRRVLLVDNDADTVDLVRAILRAAGLEVTTAKSCQQGLARLAEEWPDVVLADIMMPSSDGYEFGRQAGALAQASRRRFVAAAFTALGEEATPHALAAGFTLLIAKPVQPEALLNTLAALAASA
jgi:RNA polymerase sigma-70 factor, ECF subfamily